ncbi:MAG TPA: carboxypeptidase-like regulatory domain-containing protein [Kofleriaceae bacterium]|nr:carboxypeptidase-like regulatory domain-containing protein [Kofleriaceae bacterium]
MLRQRAMSIAGILVALCTLTSEPELAEASVGGAIRARPVKAMVQPLMKREVRRTETPSVVGRVVDALGNAVADVTVVATPSFLSAGGKTTAQAAPRVRTDHAGRFRFVGLPPGEYVFVTIHGVHAATVSPAMPVAGGRSHGLDVVLIVGGTVLSA